MASIRKEIGPPFYLPSSAPSADAFTHELLHLLISKKEVYITSSLKIQLQNPIFTHILKSDLAEHIGNCLEHNKMLPIYLALGFEQNKFLFDYYEHKFGPMDRYLIQTYITEPNRLWGEAVNNYVAKYFAMQACPNEAFDYSADLRSLALLEPKLYQILDQCWVAWEKFDINIDDPIYNSYQAITFDFVSALESWITQKRLEGFPFKLQ